MKFTIVLLLTVSLLGCDSAFESSQSLKEVNDGLTVGSKNTPQCLIDSADFYIDSKILGFEIISRKKGVFGFNLLDNFFKAFGLNFEAKKGLMTSVFSLSETSDPTQYVGKVEAHATAKEREFGFNFSASQLTGELEYYKRTPLSALSGKNINDGLKKISEEIKNNGIKWKSRIVRNDNNKNFYIPAGSVAGIQPGDTFAVYNVENIWESEPCSSKLMLQRKLTNEPLAQLKVMQVAAHASHLEFVGDEGSVDIELGAIIEPINVAKELKFSIKVRNIESQKLSTEENGSFDVTPYIFDQLEAQMDDYNFYPVKMSKGN